MFFPGISHLFLCVYIYSLLFASISATPGYSCCKKYENGASGENPKPLGKSIMAERAGFHRSCAVLAPAILGRPWPSHRSLPSLAPRY